MKNAVYVGLIAGFFGGVGATVSFVVAVVTGFYSYSMSILTPTFLAAHLSFEVIIHLVYGPIFAVIYSKLYDWVPGKGVIKGLIYSYLIYLISNVRPGLLIGAHSSPAADAWPWARGLFWAGSFVFLAYGLVLGALYRKK